MVICVHRRPLSTTLACFTPTCCGVTREEAREKKMWAGIARIHGVAHLDAFVDHGQESQSLEGGEGGDKGRGRWVADEFAMAWGVVGASAVER
ncbi:hypothetical protein D8674_008895 [Pyrus ussuriensis x Pyrus communis]|uniref:Uncharacterized protein n=1 Tax=Pyrus ussuriensis x Pyrus communis TaxID=2448454 RepID=A0A5N5HU08_9ROSA|nr:hypothetical protein D8674_008895 [Pyrus ussuriensis x Pyrus communis]